MRPEAAVAYPASGIIGAFPTCENRPLAPWIQHNNFGAFFGPSYDREPDGNAGAVPDRGLASRPTTRMSASGASTQD